jgi:uncharacterized protein (TIGR00730 family)
MQSVTVFCGSKSGNHPLYEAHAVALGAMLANHGIRLVYGGGNKGLMGCVANAVMDGGGKAVGVIPQLLVEWEHQHNGLTELKVVEDMHVRKRLLYELCDAAIILPGGFGSMDELFEMLTWNALKIHDKPVFLLNSGGFYDPLLAMMYRMYDEGFLYDTVENKITVLQEPQDLLQYLPKKSEAVLL